MATVTLNPTTGECSYSMNGEATWAAARDASSAETSSTTVIRVEAREGGSGSDYNIKRASYPFDTSVIPPGSTINSAVFSAYRDDDISPMVNDSTTSLDLVVTTVTDPTTPALADYSKFGTSSKANKTLASTSDDTYADFTISDTSIITCGGYTKLGLREHNDLANTDIGTNKNNNIAFQDRGDANPPKLVVNYTPPGGMIYISV